MRFHKPSISVSHTLLMEYLGGWQCQKGKRGHDEHVLLQTPFHLVHSFVRCCIRAAFGWKSSIIKTLLVGTFSIWKLTAVKTAIWLNLKELLCCRMTTLTECWFLQYGAFVLVCVANIAVQISLHSLWLATMLGSNRHETVLSGCPRARSIWAAHYNPLHLFVTWDKIHS